MGAYLIKNKGWRYDFTMRGIRYTEAGFKTKKAAQRAEALKREELLNPTPIVELPTDMDFFELVNLRLDHVKAYNSAAHYRDYIYLAKRWVKQWGHLRCGEITPDMIERFVLKRSRSSNQVANTEIKTLRATFNFGKKRKLVEKNPVDGLDFLPIEKRLKYVPSISDIEKVISIADQDTRDYLVCICDTMARVSEINGLQWPDIDLTNQHLTLYTRKKKGGHLTPRKVPMTARLLKVLSRRYTERDRQKKWVFWHRYFNHKTKCWEEGPYKDRKRIMKTLCRKAGVKYFRFHALRHAGASLMDNNNVPIGAIQSILGHESRTTTEIYLHNLGGVERDAITVFENARTFSHT